MLTMTDPLHAMTLQGKLRETKQLLHFLILSSSYYFTTTYILQLTTYNLHLTTYNSQHNLQPTAYNL